MTASLRASEVQCGSEPGRELGLVWPLLGRHIAFHRRLVDLTHSVKAAVLLSQVIYWTRHGRDIAVTHGWFHKTAAQWERETGLTLREQAGARDVLCKLGVLDEHRRGVPALLYYKLVPQRLVVLLAALLGRPGMNLEWADGAALMELLGPALSYHRSLAAISGGVHTGLLLSRALYLTRYPLRKLPGNWFYAPSSIWANEIGLSRREQEAARQDMVRLGVWDEDIRGIPPRLYVRVRMNALLGLLTRSAGLAPQNAAGIGACEISDSGIPAIKPEVFPPSSRRDCWHPDSTKPPNQYRQNRHNSFDKSAKLNVLFSTRYLVQTPPLRAADPCAHAAAGSGGGGELIFPEKLLPEERAAAAALVSRCPELAQALLDELAARLQKNTVHTNPIAYLRGMVQRALAGGFAPELGSQVAAARRKAAEEAAGRRQREADAKRLADEQAAPGYQAAVQTRRAQVREMLERMRSRKETEQMP